jgi:hypothetical protein
LVESVHFPFEVVVVVVVVVVVLATQLQDESVVLPARLQSAMESALRQTELERSSSSEPRASSSVAGETPVLARAVELARARTTRDERNFMANV